MDVYENGDINILPEKLLNLPIDLEIFFLSVNHTSLNSKNSKRSNLNN